MDEFEVVWRKLQIALKPGAEIKNWNAYNGYLGDNLKINTIEPKYISIDPPRVWDTQVIPKDSFEKIWAVWFDYKELRLKRSNVKDMSNHSKYIISIFHWYETDRILLSRSKNINP